MSFEEHFVFLACYSLVAVESQLAAAYTSFKIATSPFFKTDSSLIYCNSSL